MPRFPLKTPFVIKSGFSQVARLPSGNSSLFHTYRSIMKVVREEETWDSNRHRRGEILECVANTQSPYSRSPNTSEVSSDPPINLPPRQAEALRQIDLLTKSLGKAPTQRDLAGAMATGDRSPKTASHRYTVKPLADKHLIERPRPGSRIGLQITSAGRAWLKQDANLLLPQSGLPLT
jgi:hypothetical protein